MRKDLKSAVLALLTAAMLMGCGPKPFLAPPETVEPIENPQSTELPTEAPTETTEPPTEAPTEDPMAARKIVYGKSGAGRDLTAYRYGEGENVLVLCFAIHGFEDAFDRDGMLLRETALGLCEVLENEYDQLIEGRNWSVYVLPTLNPDGLFDGWTHNGPGRCSTHWENDKGQLVYDGETGIDTNRSFPYDFEPYYDGRNYTGDDPLGSREGQALYEFIPSIQGDGLNYLVDTHGWCQQIIVDTGTEGDLYQNFSDFFPECPWETLRGGHGYFSGWAGYELGFTEACLFEFPLIHTPEDFYENNYQESYYNAIRQFLTTVD